MSIKRTAALAALTAGAVAATSPIGASAETLDLRAELQVVSQLGACPPGISA